MYIKSAQSNFLKIAARPNSTTRYGLNLYISTQVKHFKRNIALQRLNRFQKVIPQIQKFHIHQRT